jgi:hypothetical protein
MALRFLLISFLLTFFAGTLQAQSTTIQSPDEFLNYKLGSRFTPHHKIVDYFQYVDGLSDRIQLIEYGETYELRPLIAAIISSPANLKRIEDIRQNNLRRTGMLAGDTKDENIAIVYLSYTVHGNEAAGAESSMAVLYDLLKANTPYSKWLENTVVIMDPTLNPDGNNRYTQWSNSVSANPNNPHPSTREHNEPWPGGRTNHYYFDLNRDWAWQTQQESRLRVAFYLQWMPHVHADIHEMNHDAPYYFAPAAQPFHQHITKGQADFQMLIGKNNAAHFDKEGWRYFTKERYDLFYPSYGDTYPTFAGAIGMTYEQGGSGFANRAVLLDNGDTLSLYDRIAHHQTASLSTIEVSSNNAAALVKEFGLYFKNSIADPPGLYKSYVIRTQTNPGRVQDFLRLLTLQGIRYGVASQDYKGIKGLSYLTGDQGTYVAEKGDIIVPASQPRAVLTQVLFETGSTLVDSITYDITAWCLPMAYGLDAFATEVQLAYEPALASSTQEIAATERPYAYAMQWGSVPSTKALTNMMLKGVVARYAESPFRVDGKDYPSGTILLMRADNRKQTSFDDIVKEVAHTSVVPFTPIRTGFVESGKDFGSYDYPLVRKPKVLALSGEGVRSLNLGEIWHFFEEELKYPIDLVDAGEISTVALESYNVIILTEGYYSIESSVMDRIHKWVSSGGRLIAIGSAINKLTSKGGFEIESKGIPEPDTSENEPPVHSPEPYAGSDRRIMSEDIPGSIFQTTLDSTHPLSFGLGETYWTMKTTTSNYKWLKEGGNAIYLDDTPRYYGFAGYKALERTKNTLIAGQEEIGVGAVVYFVDNPMFRSFWNSGKVLFSNALFF